MRTTIFITLIFLVSQLFISCYPDKDASSTMNRFLVNKTNKTIIQELHTSIGFFEIKTNGYDTAHIKLFQTETIVLGLIIMPYTISVSPVSIFKEITYCIEDTTKFESTKYYSIEGYETPETKRDSIYFSFMEFNLKDRSIYHPEGDVIFTYTELVDSIMQKDYSMLDKFKQLYKD